MGENKLYALAEQMLILRLHCTFQLQESGELPTFKGSMLHGWLGQQLLKQDAELYHLLYTEHAQQQPKPYALACHDFRTHYVKNSTLSFQLTLFGSAVQLAERILQALCTLPLGVGQHRLAIKVQTIASETPTGLSLGIHPLPLLALITPAPPQVIQAVCLQLQSPLRIKQRGSIIKNGQPPLPVILNQIQKRLAALMLFWVDDNPAWQIFLNEHVRLGEHQELSNATYFEDWQRYSNSRQKLLPFGGLLGEVSYQGDIHNALDWLQIGQVLQLGGKTTFGLGCYKLIS